MIILGDAARVLKDFNDNCIDLTVTSPPYDNLRTYGGHSFDFEAIAKELYRVTKQGGVVIWVVNDSTTDGDESGTSFKQALFFKEIGFKLFDTMIYNKNIFGKPSNNRYHQTFEYMFVFSKSKPITFNPLIDRVNSHGGLKDKQLDRKPNGKYRKKKRTIIYRDYGMRYNVWTYDNARGKGSTDYITQEHPASFPEQLAADHIKSWSNEGDLILDPFAGSGTTLKAAHQLGRKWVGIEINPDYIKICKARLNKYVNQQTLDSLRLALKGVEISKPDER